MSIPILFSARQQIYDWARSHYPNEICGAILASREPVLLDNLAPDPENYFVLPPQFHQLNDVACVFHSHTNGNPEFSLQDIACAKEIGEYDWYLVCVDDRESSVENVAEDYIVVNPKKRRDIPYIGRNFRYGLADCYALCREYYLNEFDIILNDYPRSKEDEWMRPDFNMFGAENLKREGFKLIEDDSHKVGDFLVMQLANALHPNHLAMMLEPGRLIFIHHLAYQLSKREVWDGYFAKHTVSRWRHQDVMQGQASR